MAYRTAAGTAFYISSTFAATKAITILTNANPALATSSSHGYTDNQEVLLSSGWERANNAVFKVDQQSTDTFLVKGLNSTNTNLYTSGAGIGTASLVSDWIEIPQVLTVDVTGGTARNIQVNPIKLVQGLTLPNGFEPAIITFGIGFDPSLSAWDDLLDISRSETLVAYKAVKGSGAATYGYFQMSEQPTSAAGAVDTVSAQFLAQGQLVSYAA